MKLKTHVQRVLMLLVAIVPVGGHAQHVEMIHRWEIDPEIGTSWTVDEPVQPRTVDVEALRSSDLRTQVTAAQTASLLSRIGISNREQAFQAALEQLRQPQDNHQARLAFVSAAANLVENRLEAEAVWKALAAEPRVRSILEPMLLQWKSKLALEPWRQRVRSQNSGSGNIGYADLLAALDGLAIVGDSDDQVLLKPLLLQDGLALPLQLAAAKSLGVLARTGLEPLAERILASAKPQKELLAAYLLSGHAGEQTEFLLDRIMEQSNSTAHVIAYQAITRLNAERARELAERLIQHPNNNLRIATVRVLNQYDDAASLNVQAQAIMDENPGVRNMVRQNLVQKSAIPGLRELVDDVITFQLNSQRWQGIEQAMILIGRLGGTLPRAGPVAFTRSSKTRNLHPSGLGTANVGARAFVPGGHSGAMSTNYSATGGCRNCVRRGNCQDRFSV